MKYTIEGKNIRITGDDFVDTDQSPVVYFPLTSDLAKIIIAEDTAREVSIVEDPKELSLADRANKKIKEILDAEFDLFAAKSDLAIAVLNAQTRLLLALLEHTGPASRIQK